MSKLILGCGYLGLRVAAEWLKRQQQVFAVTRSTVRAENLRDRGISPIVGDLTREVDLSSLPDVDTVLIAVGFDRNPDQSIRDVYVEGLRNVLNHLPPSTRRVIYISSTGVYGQVNGEWIDESSHCEPTRESGRACLEAERTLREHSLASRAIILRLAGIYGPGRLPKLQDVIDGKPLAISTEGYLNLIHVDDAVQAILAAEQLDPPELIVISDGQPVRRGDFYRELARQHDAPEPCFVPPGSSTRRTDRGAADKRVVNQRMRELLKFSLLYPSYREGLSTTGSR